MRKIFLAVVLISAASSALAQVHPKSPISPIGSQPITGATVASVDPSVMESLLETQTKIEIPKDLESIEGTVTLDALIDPTGHVMQLKAISGPAILYQAVIESVRQWTYRPYTINGRPVQVSTRIIVQIKKSQTD